MSGADTQPPTLAEMVDREIDRCARVLCTDPDLDKCAKRAAALDVLLRYRADAERREHAAKMAVPK